MDKLAQIQFTGISDLTIMAKTIWGEARGEGYLGQVAVAWVIRNRATSPSWWGNSLISVCLKHAQFSCWNRTDPNRAHLEALDVPDPGYIRALGIACLVVTGDLADPTEGATSYHANTMPVYPVWADQAKRAAVIGRHTFYRL